MNLSFWRFSGWFGNNTRDAHQRRNDTLDQSRKQFRSSALINDQQKQKDGSRCRHSDQSDWSRPGWTNANRRLSHPSCHHVEHDWSRYLHHWDHHSLMKSNSLLHTSLDTIHKHYRAYRTNPTGLEAYPQPLSIHLEYCSSCTTYSHHSPYYRNSTAWSHQHDTRTPTLPETIQNITIGFRILFSPWAILACVSKIWCEHFWKLIIKSSLHMSL